MVTIRVVPLREVGYESITSLLRDDNLATVQDVDLAQIGEKIAMVLVPSSLMTARFINRLVTLGENQRFMPGIVFGRDQEAIDGRLAKILSVQNEYDEDAVILGESSFEYDYLNKVHYMGGRVSSHKIKGILQRGCRVLSIFGHGDGVDLKLGENSILCPTEYALNRSGTSVQLLCARNNYCYRLNRRIFKLASDFPYEELVDPGIINSQIILMDTCFGLTLQNHIHNIDRSIASYFLERARFSCLITTFRPTFSDIYTNELLFSILRSGIPAGDAVSLANSISGQGWPYVILGNPSVSLQGTVRREGSVTSDYLRLIRKRRPVRPKLVCPISTYLEAPKEVVNTGGITRLWMPQGRVDLQRPKRSRCIFCSETSYVCELEVGNIHRVIENCPQCGQTFDVPCESKLVFSYDIETCTLYSYLRGREAQVWVYVKGNKKAVLLDHQHLYNLHLCIKNYNMAILSPDCFDMYVVILFDNDLYQISFSMSVVPIPCL